MSALQPLEDGLNDVFVKKAPALPDGGKKALVNWLPWINLVLGILTLWSALWLWHWAHIANNLINYANTLNALYGTPAVASTTRLGFTVWLGLLVLVVEAILYLAAFPGTRAKKKSGWDLMFYALLVNIVYSIVLIFTSYGFGNVIGGVIGSAIGLYLLFQIRASYLKHAAPAKEA